MDEQRENDQRDIALMVNVYGYFKNGKDPFTDPSFCAALTPADIDRLKYLISLAIFTFLWE